MKEWYAVNRRGYGKKLLKLISYSFIVYGYNLSRELHLLGTTFDSILYEKNCYCKVYCIIL